MSDSNLHVTSLGGGHGLYQTLLAARGLNPAVVTAIVTVADDGGSSGRLRREFGMIPPGDLRMALAALAMATALWAANRTVFAELGTTAGLRWLALATLVGFGLAAYAVAGQALGAFDVGRLLGILRRRGGKR